MAHTHRAMITGALLLACLFCSMPEHEAAKGELRVAGWPELTEAERQLTRVDQDPDADAVVLSHERYGRLLDRTDGWVNVIDYHRRLKVLTEQGTRYGEVRIRGNKYSRVTKVMARTITPDGAIIDVDPSQIFENVISRSGNVKFIEHVFNFPAVQPGAILEYRYDRFDDYLLNVSPFYFEDEVFTLRAKVTQAIPEEAGYQIMCARCPEGTQPTLSKWREGKISGKLYEIELRDLPGYREELLMPPQREVSPRLEMVLHGWKEFYFPPLDRWHECFTDWSSVARYVAYFFDEIVKQGSKPLEPVVAEWISGVEGEDGKIRRIFERVRDGFTHIDWGSVAGWSRPIEELLKDKSADNEEAAVLLHAALKSANIDSQIAFVLGTDTGSLNDGFFSLSQFTHAIVGVHRQGGEVLWLDPTELYAPFGFVPWKNSEASALIVRKEGGQLFQLPKKQEPGRTEFSVTVHPRRDGKAGVDVTAEFSGQDGVDFRQYVGSRGADGRTEILKNWVKDIQPDAVMISHEIAGIHDLDSPLVIKMSLEMGGLVTVADDILLVNGCVFSGYESNPISTTRRTFPLYVYDGWNVLETVTIKPPEGMKAASLPETRKASAQVARMTFTCTSMLDGSVKCNRVFAARPNQWPPNKIVEFRDLFDRVVEADRTAIAFTPDVAGGL